MEVLHTFSITGASLPERTRIVAFRGSEMISKPYRVEAFLLVPEGSVTSFDPRAVLGRRATVAIHRETGEVRRAVHGMWSSVALARALPGGDALYRAVLAPHLWRLSLARRSRVFVDQTVPEIVESVLRECGFEDGEYTFRLENARRYTPLDHVCQYRETNLDFVSRRLEQAGLYYYFEHPEEGAAERLVITDSVTFAEPLDDTPVRFLATDDASGATEGLRNLSCQYAAVPSGARTHGHNYLTPSVDVGGESLRALDDPFVVNSWEPTRTDAEGRRVAALRLEEIKARETTLEGSGRVFNVRAGYLFELDEHPILAGEYLATGVEFRGCDVTANRDLTRRLGFGDEVFEVDVTAIPGSVQFRPERVTPRPRAHGMELGVVRGPQQSPYAQVDAHGRYLVQLLFDEHTEKAAPSTRMRMAQPHGGGNGMGFHFPLRNGTEVLVSFVRGDPDLPVIAGVVPNAETASPITSENNTRNVVQTGGGSRLEIEDQEGAEYVKWTTPYKNTRFHLGAPHNPTTDIDLSTGGTALIETGVDNEMVVGRNRRAFVGSKVWEEYGPRPAGSTAFTPPVDPSLYPAGTHTTNIYGTRDTTVTSDVTETYRTNQTTMVNGRTARVYGVAGTPPPPPDAPPTLSTTVHGNEERTVNGSVRTSVAVDVTSTVGGTLDETIVGDWNVTCLSKNETITGPEEVTKWEATKEIKLGASLELSIAASLALGLAADVEIKAGGTSETVIGIKNENVIGMKLEWVAGPNIELKGFKFENEATKIENVLTRLRAGTITLQNAVLEIHS